MALLRDPRSRLVAIYAALVALGYFIHALPGGPFYRSNGEYAIWIVVDVILIAYIAAGSRLATAVPLVLNVFFLPLFFLTAPSDLIAADVAAWAAVLVAQTLVLVRLLFRRPAVQPSGAAPAA
jgi:hypothetical protein